MIQGTGHRDDLGRPATPRDRDSGSQNRAVAVANGAETSPETLGNDAMKNLIQCALPIGSTVDRDTMMSGTNVGWTQEWSFEEYLR